MVEGATRYSLYRKRRRCVCCGGQDEDTLNGRTHCAFCAAKRRLYAKKYNEKKMKLYYEWKAAGLCTRCGGERDNETLLCNLCRKKQSVNMARFIERMKARDDSQGNT